MPTGQFIGYIGVGIDVHERKLSEDALKKNEERFRNLVEKAPYPICIFKGRDMLLELANESMLNVWNVGQEALGKPFAEIAPNLKDQPFMGWLTEVFDTGKTHYANEHPTYFIRKNKNKETIYLNFVYQPYYENDGSISGVMVLATDVTIQVISRKKTEAQAVLVQELLMTAPGFICTLRGPAHVYEVVNEKYQQLFGKRKIKGKAIMEALPELEGQGFDTLLDKVYQTGEPYVGIDIPITIARDENLAPELRYFNFSYQPIYDENKIIYSILVFGYEVTEQVLAKNKNLEDYQTHSKELEQSVQQRTFELRQANEELVQKNGELSIAKEKLFSEYSRNLIEATIDPLITMDTDGRITDVNEAMAKATDKSRDNLIGSDFSNYFIEKQKAEDMYRQVFAKGHVINFPLSIIDGVITDVLINASIYKNGNADAVGAVLVARDITQLKKIEKELTEAKIFAEEAARKAQSATQIAKNPVNAKQQFLSNMSHEIRTPMNAIIGFTKVVLKTELSAKQKEYLSAIKISGDALIVLINDILDLAKVDAGKMTFEEIPFKLSLSVSAMLHLFETKIHEKNLKLHKEYDNKIPDVLIGDPVRLHQVILNLVSNAVKFTSKGKITLGVQQIAEDEKTVSIQFLVADTGIGIAENKLGTIFENFQQASFGTSRLYGGTGLGLAIVKQLIESQGGSISVTSKVNEGSVFGFILHFKKTKENAPSENEIIEMDTKMKSLKILVVEDMALNQLLMKTILEDFKFSCDIATNGKLAIEKLETNTYDIILMDLQMPVMNGFETTEYIRNTMQYTIPIIALTADVTTVDVAKCKAAGMNDYIAKPIDEKLLYNKILGLVTKPLQASNNNSAENEPASDKTKRARYTNTAYLARVTKGSPKLMAEMISLYLRQTPQLIIAMKQSFLNKDWNTLQSSVHKMVPSFAIVGIEVSFETMAKKVQEYARNPLNHQEAGQMVLQLEKVCTQACKEMEEELEQIKISIV